MQFADYAAPEVCATPPFRLNRRARRSGTCPQATQPHASMRPQPKQPSKTMRTLITATHSRSVQYSQDHAYGQEAPTPSPVPSSPRGRGLVEPYRPLGPLPPRTVRAVARLGPHPVADGHLVDVAALAAPPCQLAAYGLHAGGLQALLMRGCHIAAMPGCVMARSLKPASTLRPEQYGQLSSTRMKRMLTFSRQTWPHGPRHHTMAPAWAWRSSARRPPFSSGSSCLATSGLFDPRSLLPLAR